MKIRILGVFTLFCFFAQAQDALDTSDELDSSYYADRFFVKFKEVNNENAASLTFLLQNISVAQISKVSTNQELAGVYHVFLNKENVQLDSLLTQLSLDPRIEYAEREPIYRLFFTPNDPQYSSQWNLAKIQADQAWNLSQGCSNIKIAITDDGFLLNHEDLINQWHINTGEIIGNGIDDDGNGYIDDWRGWDAAMNDNDPSAVSPTNSIFTHGTHVAGITAGATNNNLGIASIGYNSKLIPVKIANNGGSLTGAIQGLDYAINGSGCDVINMSWGGSGFSTTYQTLFNLAKTKGIICVAAAGNSSSASPMYPASYNHVISVASTSSSDALSSFSNYGSTIDVAAPGSSILSSLAGSNSSYGSLSGTSMASPLVAGLCALMKCYNPMPADSIEACLKRSCTNINSQNLTKTGQFGSGRINAFQALQCLSTKPVSSFIVKDTIQCPGKSVRYEASSFGAPTLTYSWSFPGGTPSTSSLKNPIITYAASGNYSATLVTTNSFGSDSKTISNAVIIDTPEATLTGRSYTSYNTNAVIITVKFRGNPPYQVSLTDGTNSWTQSNIQSNPYFFSMVPSKDTSFITISNFQDSFCLGNKLGRDTIYKVLFGIPGSSTDCDTSNLSTGRVLHLDFNGNTLDKSGNGNHATNYGATAVAGKDGVANSAYRFNGTSNYMSVAHAASLNLNAVTMCAILKPRAFYPGVCMSNIIITKGYDLPGGAGRYAMQYQPVPANCTSADDTTKSNFYMFIKGYNGCSNSFINTYPKVQTNKWYCVVGTHNQDTMKFYVDGLLTYSCYVPGSIGSNTFDIILGKQPHPTGNFPFWLNADVDDIRVYNRALAPSEVKGYCGTCQLQPPPLDCDTSKLTIGRALHLDFSGNTQDASGNGNHATNFGATLTTDKNGNPNSAYEFNNSYMSIPNTTSLQNIQDSFSICLNYNSYDSIHANILGWNNYTNGSGYTMHIYHSWTAKNRAGYAIGNQPSTCNTSAAVREGSTQFTPNAWHCLVLVSKNRNIKLYVDNILLDSSYYSTFIPIIGHCSNTNLRLGRWWSGDLQSFKGKIDDVRVYNRTLAPSEVKGYCGTCQIQPPPISKKCDSSKRFRYLKCVNSPASLFARSGSSYQWSPNINLSSDTIQNPISTTSTNKTYLVSYIDTAGCTLVDTFLVTVKQAAMQVPMNDALICIGDSVQVAIPIAATSIQWSPSFNISDPNSKQPFLYPTSTTEYRVQYTDSLGCNHFDTIIIYTKVCCNTRAKFLVSDTTLCLGTNLDITNRSTGPILNYNWNFGNANPPSSVNANPSTVKFSRGGLYTVRLIVQGPLCSDTLFRQIQVIEIKPFAGKDSLSNCLGNLTLNLGESGISDWSYSWSPTTYLSDPSIADPICAIIGDSVNYIVTATDRNSGCTGSDTVTVSTNPKTNTVSNFKLLCQGDSVLFHGKYYQDSGTYLKKTLTSNGLCDSIIEVLRVQVVKIKRIARPSGRYCEKYIDALGIQHDTSFTSYDTIRSKTVLCDSIIYSKVHIISKRKIEIAELKGCKEVIYKNFKHRTTKMRADSFTVKSVITGCDSLYKIINIIVYPGPKAKISPSASNPVYIKSNVLLTASGGLSYRWAPSGTTDSALLSGSERVPTRNMFTVVVTDKDSCIDSASYIIRDTCTYGIPNVFTPNGDQVNDIYIPNLDSCATIRTFIIFNRWGEKMFETHTRSGWNGYFKGSTAPLGVYSYYLELDTYWGRREHSGSFVLMR